MWKNGNTWTSRCERASGSNQEREPRVTAGERPPLIYDYYNFPPESYKIKYPAPGDPALAHRVVDALRCALPSLGQEAPSPLTTKTHTRTQQQATAHSLTHTHARTHGERGKEGERGGGRQKTV